MKINSIINRYIFKEMIPPFCINLGFLTFVFLLAQILEVTNMVVNYRASIVSVLLLLLYSMPDFLNFTIPMSIMMAVLMTFLKMSGDNEIIAIKAGGGNIYTLLFPVMLFCIIGFAMTIIMSVYGISWGKEAYKKLVVEIASTSADAALKERTFNDSFDGVIFYVNKIDIKNKTLHDVFIEDQREEENKSTVIAPRGKRFVDPNDKSTFIIRLYDGVINRVNRDNNSVNTVSFGTYDITVPIKKASVKKKEGKDRDEMSISELKAVINDDSVKDEFRRAAAMELHEKFSIPFACIALGLLAMPLGLKSAFSKKSSGLGLGVMCFLLYYFFIGFAWSAGKAGILSPAFGMWLPNLVMGGAGVFFFIRVAKEKTLGIEFVFGVFRYLPRLFKKRDRN